MFFERYADNRCCLCGSSGNLTGEHLVKASAIRREFGNRPLRIGNVEAGAFRAAQGPKSKAFHHRARMCATCNGARTQNADREFDRFSEVARGMLDAGKNPAEAFSGPRYKSNSEAYLNVFRYFAKLLCCHIADVGGPRPIHMSRFATGSVGRNCIWLAVDEDWEYKQASERFGVHAYAAHGGLVIYGDRKTGLPNAFHSTLTIGSVRFVYWSRLTAPERLAIRLAHPTFHQWCRARVRRADLDPLADNEMLKLGLMSGQDNVEEAP